MKTLAKRLLGWVGLARAAFRAREQLRAFSRRPCAVSAPDDGFPVPPANLVVLVTGSADPGWYARSGRLACDSIRQILSEAGLDISGFRSVLDFGCGCGRVIRHWPSLTAAALYGSDCNLSPIQWCRANLPFANFALNTLEPRLQYADEQFEFAYALSVLTHTPQDLQQAWMDELWRILQPGGYLLLTTQGREYLSRLTPNERTQFHRGGLVVRYESAAGTNLCSIYHPESYVRKRLARRFSVTRCKPGGATGNGNQDMYLLRKHAHAPLVP